MLVLVRLARENVADRVVEAAGEDAAEAVRLRGEGRGRAGRRQIHRDLPLQRVQGPAGERLRIVGPVLQADALGHVLRQALEEVRATQLPTALQKGQAGRQIEEADEQRHAVGEGLVKGGRLRVDAFPQLGAHRVEERMPDLVRDGIGARGRKRLPGGGLPAKERHRGAVVVGVESAPGVVLQGQHALAVVPRRRRRPERGPGFQCRERGFAALPEAELDAVELIDGLRHRRGVAEAHRRLPGIGPRRLLPRRQDVHGQRIVRDEADRHVYGEAVKVTVRS